MDLTEHQGRTAWRVLSGNVVRGGAIAALFLVILSSAGWAAEQNPFEKKFGDVSKSIGPVYRAVVVEYGKTWMMAYRFAGPSAISDKESMDVLLKKEVDPRLAQMKPTTPEETRLKEAATYVRTVFASLADPASLTAAELKARDEFLASVVPADEDKELPSKLAFFLIRFQQYVAGLGMDLPRRAPEQKQ